MTQTNNPSSNAAPPPASSSGPPRTRKTHATEVVIFALKKLSRREKLNKNEDIKAHNAYRAVKRAQNVTTPSTTFVDSDDESVITISDSEENTMTTPPPLPLRPSTTPSQSCPRLLLRI
ncbi:hypothetical protein C8J57DRAFT_1249696 [Mycena rebaudengoi]|nr:hypothetical protein C8J57DRAFT_1249696 [Mycena rebaudengoi]